MRIFWNIVAVGVVGLTGLAAWGQSSNSVPDFVRVKSRASLVHLGSIDSFDRTEGGIAAAKRLLAALENHDPKEAAEAKAIYQKIIPNENFGGEYTALEWFCDYLLAPEAERPAFLTDRFVDATFHFFADNDFATLKEYLKRKYKLAEMEDADRPEGQRRQGFLEDFILFNNPRRERWEKTSKIYEVLNIKPGQVVADIGCGPGFYSFEFAKKVGPAGRVYALDINDLHVQYVSNLAVRLQVPNIIPVVSQVRSILITNQVDLAYMCSLYHIIYTTLTEPEKDSFVASIRAVLKPDGIFAVVDNAFVEDKTLPYHGPYIARELLVAQLQHYGFRLVSAHQFIPQRYVLLFRKDDSLLQPGGPEPVRPNPDPDLIQPDSKRSLTHVPNDASPDITREGRKAAKLFYTAMDQNDQEAARAALKIYRDIIPKERFGDEYTAFQWFCEYLLATRAERRAMLAPPYTKDYFEFLAGNNYEVLKKYVRNRYHLEQPQEKEPEPTHTSGFVAVKKRYLPKKEDKRGPTTPATTEEEPPPGPPGPPPPPSGSDKQDQDQTVPSGPPRPVDKDGKPIAPEVTQDQMAFWRDFVLFNNPYRENWEKTSCMIQALNVKRGQAIADVGCGPGYYTFKFADLVGPRGRVYALETNTRHLDFVTEICRRYKLQNIRPLESKFNDVCLPADSVDMVYLCSLYGIIYTTSMEKVKDEFVASIHRALRQDGRLVIVDNAVVPDGTVPYHGPYIAKELIIAQMRHYGFDLEKTAQFIPQRYMLFFKKSQTPVTD